MIGETFSHYRITKRLGEGAMGEVYQADDLTLGREVAIKFLSSTTREYRARFLREVRSVSALSHPNIATVFDYGETAEGRPYIVMELIKGESLSDKLQDGSLPLPEAVRIVLSIAEALSEAHHHGIVHRDVKPSNVVVSERGRTKLLDFGLVKQIEEHASFAVDPNSKTLPSTHTQSNVIVGTPLYLSPEQATGRKVDARSDLFALGVVLYECITGQSAFSGETLIEIGAQVLHFTPVIPSSLNNRIPPELDRITMKAIEKKVEDRYQSADELVEDLRALLPQLSDDGYRRGRATEPLQKPVTQNASALRTIAEAVRKPRLSLVNVLITIVLLAAVAYGISQIIKPRPYQPPAPVAKLYQQGIEALTNGAFLQASKAFDQAIALDPKFPLAHARLAESLFELDYADKAKDEMLRTQAIAPDHSRLARTDAVRIEAINATIARDFPGAIALYTELVRLSPNDPQVYLDLGRAYERNDDRNKAIESYVEAAQRAPQYATPFLRVAILYGEKTEQASAQANFDKAQALFESSGNYEGQGEVAFQRGTLFDNANKEAEARPHLERALELAKTTSNLYLEIKTLLKLGNLTAADGNADGGRASIQKAIDLAQSNGVDNQVKRGLVDMGNTYILVADYSGAEKYFRQSLALSQQQKDNRNAARALLSLSIALERQSKADDALQSLEQALPFYQKSGYGKEALIALVVLARIKAQKGEYPAALEAYDQQLTIAKKLDDPSLLLPVYGDIGLTLITLGRFTEALPHFDEAYVISKSLHRDNETGLALVSRATALWQLGRFDEARRFLAEATPLTEQTNAPKNLMALYHLAAARMALSENNWSEAKTRSQKAMDVAGTQLKRAATESNYTMGLAQTFSGAAGEGRASCNRALTIAEQAGNPTLRAEALLALAQALLQGGDRSGALKAAQESQELLSRLGEPQFEWLALAVSAIVSHESKDDQRAQSYLAQAERILAGLQERWGSDNYNSYLKRPDIQFYQKQLNQLQPKA